jgi:hypothetical protein
MAILRRFHGMPKQDRPRRWNKAGADRAFTPAVIVSTQLNNGPWPGEFDANDFSTVSCAGAHRRPAFYDSIKILAKHPTTSFDARRRSTGPQPDQWGLDSARLSAATVRACRLEIPPRSPPLFSHWARASSSARIGTPRLQACTPWLTHSFRTSMISSWVAPAASAPLMCRRVPGAYMWV